MCNVHLTEQHREHGVSWNGFCSFCSERIHGLCDVVYGVLDDGTPGVQVLRYHPGCLDGIEYGGMAENDGWFNYGTVAEVLRN